MRRAKRRDGNEDEIVDALEAIGCAIIYLDAFDLLVLHRRRVVMLEIKNPDGRDKLTDSQQDLLDRGWPLKVVRTVDEALKAVKI